MNVRPSAAAFAMSGALLLTALIYWPGLSGGFLFDDFETLGKIGARGPIDSLELLRVYLTSGDSGPTGRPLSLLSFLLDANTWPADPWPFKRTNLVIHLAVGALLYLTARKLLEGIGRRSEDAAWIATLTATLWLVNPFLVSTTLYSVQRMTQLAALFVLAGVWCYLEGRSLLASRPRACYTTLTVGIGLCTLLAVLSKENGALLPLLVLVLHATLRRQWTTPPPSRAWVLAFLGLPSMLLFGYLLSRVPLADRLYESRSFTVYERLLTEARILWDYLYYLLVPHIQTPGLFQDGRTVSSGFLQPWTTLPALVGLIGLAVLLWLRRASAPVFVFAVAFFFAAHLLESTSVPLELYFEHRNYLPAAFLFLPAAAFAYDKFRAAARPAVVLAAIAAVIGTYSLVTWQHASLWGNQDRLLLVWGQGNPRSARAQAAVAQVLIENGRPDAALERLESALATNPDNALLIANVVAYHAALGTLSVAELESAAQRLRNVPFDAEAVGALEHLVKTLNERAPLPQHARIVAALLQDIRQDLAGRNPSVHARTLYLQGLLLAGQGMTADALPLLVDAMEKLGSVDSALRIVSDTAILGRFGVALELLGRAETLLAATSDRELRSNRTTYESEIARLRAALLEDLAADRPARDSDAAIDQDALGAEPR